MCGDTVPLEYMDVPDCFTHEGVYAGVKWLYQTIENTLKKSIKEHQGWPLVITGHSLGGGSSVLMYVHIKTKIFKDEFPDVKMLC